MFIKRPMISKINLIKTLLCLTRRTLVWSEKYTCRIKIHKNFISYQKEVGKWALLKRQEWTLPYNVSIWFSRSSEYSSQPPNAICKMNSRDWGKVGDIQMKLRSKATNLMQRCGRLCTRIALLRLLSPHLLSVHYEWFITGVKTSGNLGHLSFCRKGERFSCSFLAYDYTNALSAGDLFIYFKRFDNLKKLKY